MLRTFSTRPSHHGYQELLDGYETSSFDSHGYHGNLSRVASVSGKIFSPSRKFPLEKIIESPSSNHSDKHAKKASKVHPIFALFGSSKISKKATARPEFQRYINYLKDGGILAHAK
ncbi:hypothetical protein Leryth_007013 [Lithospermum erythrorhizon]|uniref:Uncharacterized protein n=1 Tax=Lithospermum erythrorhizon TaxID=34254 RepID=A0AAV3RBV9_LITER|nr:hypothetical protein Leryth_007013 [Lithospermum erythrorhizon]